MVNKDYQKGCLVMPLSLVQLGVQPAARCAAVDASGLLSALINCVSLLCRRDSHAHTHTHTGTSRRPVANTRCAICTDQQVPVTSSSAPRPSAAAAASTAWNAGLRLPLKPGVNGVVEKNTHELKPKADYTESIWGGGVSYSGPLQTGWVCSPHARVGSRKKSPVGS